MSLKSNALVTISEVQGLRPSANLAQAELVINAISQDVEDYLGRSLQYATVTEQVASNGGDFLQLGRRPIVTVASVTAFGSVLTDYSRTPRWDSWGALYRKIGWPSSFSGTGPPTDDPDLRFPDRTGIVVEYSGGWQLPNDPPSSGVSPLPDNIRLAVLNEVVATLDGLSTAAYGNRTMDLVEESTPGGWRRKWTSSTGRQNNRLSPSTIAVLKRYSPRTV